MGKTGNTLSVRGNVKRLKWGDKHGTLFCISILLHILSLSKGLLRTAFGWAALLVIIALALNQGALLAFSKNSDEEYGNRAKEEMRNVAVQAFGAVMAEGIIHVSAQAREETEVENMNVAAVTGALVPSPSYKESSGGIEKYQVKRNDTLASIAKKFGVSSETIKAANPGAGTRLAVGSTLTILPVSGLLYHVESGDTLESIAKKYRADAQAIKLYNPAHASIFESGEGTIIVPNVTAPAVSRKQE